MREQAGNMFTLRRSEDWVVVSTNVGWRPSGENVMGAGVAKQASTIYPELPLLYGNWCKEHKDKLYFNEDLKIICIPSKRLCEPLPHLSWKYDSDPGTIIHSYKQLKKFAEERPDDIIYCPLLGASNGKLSPMVAYILITSVRLPDNVVFVRR